MVLQGLSLSGAALILGIGLLRTVRGPRPSV
jgi:hypothetical protein